MTAAELYEEIKAVADYLDCGFRNLDSIEVTLVGKEICFQANGRTCLLSIPQKDASPDSEHKHD